MSEQTYNDMPVSVRLHYKVPGFGGKMFNDELHYLSDLSALARYWATCPNIADWELLA